MFIAQGLEILQGARVIHRDIKPGNILIDNSGRVILTDFGVVRALEGTMDLATTNAGTTIYMSAYNQHHASVWVRKETRNAERSPCTELMYSICVPIFSTLFRAPERVSGDSLGYSYASDLWSLGISLLYLATGVFPYQTSGGYFGIVKSIRDDPVPTLPEVHPVSKQPYSPEFIDLLSKFLQKDPAARTNAPTLLQHPFFANADAKWDAALAEAKKKGEEIHPLMALSPGDLADLDLILRELFRTSYAKSGPNYKGSLMHQARMAKLAENLRNPKLDQQVISERFDKIFAAQQAGGAGAAAGAKK
jgi:serine/threonine protein kinase